MIGRLKTSHSPKRNHLQFFFYFIYYSNFHYPMLSLDHSIIENSPLFQAIYSEGQSASLRIPGSPYRLMPTVLGKGTFGVVFEGLHEQTNEKVAVKVSKFGQPTRNQIQILKKLSDEPTAMKFHGHYNYLDEQLIVIEFFKTSLRAFMIEQGRLLQETALSLLLKIIYALKPLKKNRILHRDIKPQNIFLNSISDNSLKMGDFGLALEQDKKLSTFMRSKIGTLQYMAPEVIEFGEYTEKSEVWSLGIILYEMITGRFPLKNAQYKQKNELYKRVMTTEIVYPEKYPQAEKICRSCLQLSSKKRISLQEIENILEKMNKIQVQNNINGYFFGQKIKLLIEQLKKRLKRQHLKPEIIKKMEEECNLLLQQDITFILCKKKTLKLSSYINIMKPIIECSKTNKQIALNIEEFMLVDTLLILRECIENQKEQNQKILNEHLNFQGKKKDIEYYKKIRNLFLTKPSD